MDNRTSAHPRLFWGYLAIVLCSCLAMAAPRPAVATNDALSGRWRNSKGSVTVKIQQCGKTWCGIVVEATEKAKERARDGGTRSLIGTRVLSGVQRAGANSFKGQVFDPKRNIHAMATIRLISPSILRVRGCVLAGLICKEQQWIRAE